MNRRDEVAAAHAGNRILEGDRENRIAGRRSGKSWSAALAADEPIVRSRERGGAAAARVVDRRVAVGAEIAVVAYECADGCARRVLQHQHGPHDRFGRREVHLARDIEAGQDLHAAVQGGAMARIRGYHAARIGIAARAERARGGEIDVPGKCTVVRVVARARRSVQRCARYPPPAARGRKRNVRVDVPGRVGDGRASIPLRRVSQSVAARWHPRMRPRRRLFANSLNLRLLRVLLIVAPVHRKNLDRQGRHARTTDLDPVFRISDHSAVRRVTSLRRSTDALAMRNETSAPIEKHSIADTPSSSP